MCDHLLQWHCWLHHYFLPDDSAPSHWSAQRSLLVKDDHVFLDVQAEFVCFTFSNFQFPGHFIATLKATVHRPNRRGFSHGKDRRSRPSAKPSWLLQVKADDFQMYPQTSELYLIACFLLDLCRAQALLLSLLPIWFWHFKTLQGTKLQSWQNLWPLAAILAQKTRMTWQERFFQDPEFTLAWWKRPGQGAGGRGQGPKSGQGVPKFKSLERPETSRKTKGWFQLSMHSLLTIRRPKVCSSTYFGSCKAENLLSLQLTNLHTWSANFGTKILVSLRGPEPQSLKNITCKFWGF